MRGQGTSFARLTQVLGAVAQSGSAPRSHRGGQGFKSPQLHRERSSRFGWVYIHVSGKASVPAFPRRRRRPRLLHPRRASPWLPCTGHPGQRDGLRLSQERSGSPGSGAGPRRARGLCASPQPDAACRGRFLAIGLERRLDCGQPALHHTAELAVCQRPDVVLDVAPP